MTLFRHTADLIPQYVRLKEHVRKNNTHPVVMTGLSHIHKAHFIAALLGGDIDTPLLVIAETEGAASRLCEDVNVMLGGEFTAVFPVKDLNFAGVVAESRDYEQRRINVLDGLSSGRITCAFCTAEAAMQYTVPVDVLMQRTITLAPGMDITMDSLVSQLIAAGYTRREMVDGKSQFSVRGAIADIYPVNMKYPVRIEFWGDEIDTISVFDLETQRRTDTLKTLRVTPVTETLFESGEELSDKIAALSKKIRSKNAAEIREKLNADIERLKSGLDVNVPDKYFPLCYKDYKKTTVFDYIKNVIVCEYTAVSEAVKSFMAQYIEDLKSLLEQSVLCKGLDEFQTEPVVFHEYINQKTKAFFETFASSISVKHEEPINVNALQSSPWSGELKPLEEELRRYINLGYAVTVYAGTEKSARLIAEDLRDLNLPADYSSNPKKLFAKKIYITSGTLSSGYDYTEIKCAVITHVKVNDTSHRAIKKRKKAEIISSLADLTPGDLVVHVTNGIGVFDSVQKLETSGISKDYIKIKYAGTGVLYVPVTQLDNVSKYIGPGDANTIKLNKLGSAEWGRAKTRAKAAAKEMAQELIELYSRRMKAKGYAFAEDDEWQKSFEDHFEYTETDDQLRSIAEIKEDMQKKAPMERLLCGDVGFGKTEVALRAAFKCVMSGKQCAILVPTTVLAWQHYQTVMRRMEGFPAKVELLSRFRTAKEQRKIVKMLATGEVDIVIGTHRLVQKDIVFKDLGLAIIDEEQRFGVAHKERFKEMFAQVDMLTLSATPIPRTLNMAMSGIRDMSVIDEPPQDRHPVTTYVIEHDDGVIAGAIMRELRRNGQVYYIHNRIETISSCAANLQKLVPEARFGIAHGRMDESELLDIWRRLLDGDIDVLVCTTLIETGIDVGNCNTLVIENADYMGLAQLYQLRGRVGRTSRRAYAYFTFKRGKVLSEISTKRLNAIREFTQFGSGFKIAMRDLEIRGAGSILGAKQHGHMEAVGYDMYIKLLNQAIAEQKGLVEAEKEDIECLVDIKIDAYIPDKYISSQNQRIACYKRIASIKNEEDATDVIDELIDRYGDLPKSVEGLISVARLRAMAMQSGITDIVQNENTLVFYTKNPDLNKLANISEVYGKRLMLNMKERVNFTIKLIKNDNPLDVMKCVTENLMRT